MSMTDASIFARLVQIVGPSYALADPAQLSPYSIAGQLPAAVVWPGSPTEIVEIVKFAVREKLALIPTGARTKLAMGMPPTRYDLALDMTRLDKIIAYDPDDLTLGVEPGVLLSRLEGVLAGHKQFLPLAVPWMNSGTVGGAIASGVDSPLRQFYGTARDYLLGIGFVTGDGQIAKGGGSVVKNVSGYDIHKLMIGALGTLGVMTRINFRTFPVPASTRVFAAIVESTAHAVDLRNGVAHSPLRPLTMDILSPLACELFSSNAVQSESGPLPTGLFPRTHWAFVVSFAGTKNILDRYERDLRQIAQHTALKSKTLRIAVLDTDNASGILARLREFVPIALGSSKAATVVKMSVLPGRITRLLDTSERAAREFDLPWASIIRGVGVMYFVLLPTDLNEIARDRSLQVTERMLAECAALDGTASIPWCPAEWKFSLKVCGNRRGEFDQMHKLKDVFDPGRILSPGRFAGAF
jgi:glycolate oxidase FAD binding subunit